MSHVRMRWVGFAKLDKRFEGNESPFVMESEPSFADAVLGAFLRYTWAALGKESKEWKDIVRW